MESRARDCPPLTWQLFNRQSPSSWSPSSISRPSWPPSSCSLSDSCSTEIGTVWCTQYQVESTWLHMWAILWVLDMFFRLQMQLSLLLPGTNLCPLALPLGCSSSTWTSAALCLYIPTGRASRFHRECFSWLVCWALWTVLKCLFILSCRIFGCQLWGPIPPPHSSKPQCHHVCACQ